MICESCGGRLMWGGMAWVQHAPETCQRRRAAMLAELARAADKDNAVHAAIDVGAAAVAIGATQEEIRAALAPRCAAHGERLQDDGSCIACLLSEADLGWRS